MPPARQPQCSASHEATVPKTAQDTLLSLFEIPKRKKHFRGPRTFSGQVPVSWNKPPTLYAVQQIPVQNSTQNHTIPLSPWTKLLNILFHTPPPPPPFYDDLPVSMRACCTHVCLHVCMCVCVCVWGGGGGGTGR